MQHIFSKFVNLNFKAKLIFIICLFQIALVIIVSWFHYSWHSKQSTRQTINQTQQIIEQIHVNIENYIDELYRLTLSPYYNDTVMNELEKPSSYDILYHKRTIENFLASVMTLPRSEILRVYILTGNDIYSYTRTPYEMADYNDYQKSDWYQAALQTTKPVFVPVHSERVFGDKKTQIFSIVRQIKSKENNNLTLGVIKVNANYTGIQSICDKVKFENGGALFVIDANGKMVYQNSSLADTNLLDEINLKKKNGDFTCNVNNKKYIVNISSLDESGLQIVAVNSYQGLTSAARKNIGRSVLLAIICICISIVVLILFIQRFFHPLFYIIDTMKIVQTGNLSVLAPVKNKDEIGYLAEAFNTTIIKLKENIDNNTNLIKQIYEAQYLHKESQYNALCSQIRPHFINNTLNTISLLIKCDENEKAIEMIENFSFFLAGIMNTDKDITLESELKILTSYLSVLEIRYGERLSYQIDIDPAFYSFKIPALTLQPIVENAIKHGCEHKRQNTHITVSSLSAKNSLNIIIADNGTGISENALLSLRSKLENDDELKSQNSNTWNQNIGLMNVHRRLKLKFGKNSGIEIDSIKDFGTTVTIHIPK